MEEIRISVIEPRPNATGYIITPGFKEGLLYQRAELINSLQYYLDEGRAIRQDINSELESVRAIDEKITQAKNSGSIEEIENLHRKHESERDLVEIFKEDYLRRSSRIYSWVIAYNLPKGDRRKRIYPCVESGDLEEVIDQAAAIFSRHARIRTLDSPLFSHNLQYSNSERKWYNTWGHVPRSVPRYREFPAPEGVLQYFRKECRKRRQRLIEEID